MRTSSSKMAAKILASVVLVGGAASVAGLGTFGSFTSTTSASETVSTGKVVLGLTQHATMGTTVAATNLVPGDTIQRAVTLTRSGDSETFGSVKLSTSALTPNVLSSDATNGLQLTVDACSTAWVKAATTNALTCSGTTTSVLATRPVIGSTLDLPVAATQLNASSAANLRVQMVLPTGADNSFQGLSNAITFTFDATQRAADFR
jgi:hypothetical protein